MEPRIVARNEMTLVGLVSSGGDIGALWDRFSPREEAIQHRVEGAWYELHVYPEEGLPWYLVGVEVTRAESVPDEMFVKPLAAGSWAVFSHRPGLGQPDHGYPALNESIRQWLAVAPYRQVRTISLQVYDARFKGMDNPDSEQDLLIPVEPR